MAMASVAGIFGLIIYLFVLMFPIALLVALQVWLCRKNVKLGLILPGISLALSLLLTLSLAGFGALTIGGGTLTVRDEITGEIIQQENFESDVQINPAAFVGAGVFFLVSNIPTAVFGGIWLHYKGRRDTLEDLRRMQIEDLE